MEDFLKMVLSFMLMSFLAPFVFAGMMLVSLIGIGDTFFVYIVAIVLALYVISIFALKGGSYSLNYLGVAVIVLIAMYGLNLGIDFFFESFDEVAPTDGISALMNKIISFKVMGFIILKGIIKVMIIYAIGKCVHSHVKSLKDEKVTA